MTRRPLPRAAALSGLAAALLLMAAALPQSKSALIAGRIVDETGQACANVRVVASTPTAPKKRWSTVSNPLGEFSLPVPVGDATYTLEASGSRHYTADVQTVEVHGDEPVQVVFTLHIK